MKKVCGNCRFCKRAISSMPCRICKDWNRWKPKKETTEFTIEELEKIKAKMEVIHNRYAINFQGFSMSVAQECIDIINKEIAEIKGENNENSN